MTASMATAPSATGVTARQEWARHWPAMAACMSGMLLGSIATYAFGLFIQPLQDEFGWSRAEMSSALTVVSVISFFAFPFVGRLVDRFGVRAIALPGVLLNGVMFAAIGMINNGSIAIWWLSWAMFALAFAMVNPTVWAKAVSRRFTAGQGFALAILMCGSTLATLIIPSLSGWAIDRFGWRWAFAVVGMVPSLAAFSLGLLALRERDIGTAALAAGAPQSGMSDQPGYTFAEAIRSPAVIKLLLSLLLTMGITVGSLVHMVPILSERGLDRASAAVAISVFGLGSTGTKLLCGWLTDRGVDTRWLGVVTFGAIAPGCALLLIPAPGFVVAALALLFISTAAGGMMQLSAVLTIRYSGLRSFGQVYGLVAGLLAISGGFGPLVAGLIFDVTGSYTGLMLVGLPVAAVTMLMMATLGPRPVFPAGRSA